MFSAERICEKVQFKLGEKVIDVYLGGFSKMKAITELGDKIKKYSDELQKQTNQSDTEKMMVLFGSTVIDLFEAIFGKETTNELLVFYENNYEEMLSAMLPFIVNEYLPKLREYVKKISKQKADEILSRE